MKRFARTGSDATESMDAGAVPTPPTSERGRSNGLSDAAAAELAQRFASTLPPATAPTSEGAGVVCVIGQAVAAGDAVTAAWAALGRRIAADSMRVGGIQCAITASEHVYTVVLTGSWLPGWVDVERPQRR